MPPPTPPPSGSSPPPSAQAPAGGVTPPAAQSLPNPVQSCQAGDDPRTIILAYGVGHRPIDGNEVVMADRLVELGVDAGKLDRSADGFTYNARDAHHAVYTVKFVYTRADFKTYLHSPEVHLIYCGHSREGRGPCFLDKSTPEGKGEYWGDDGIFKMAFDFIGAPTNDINENEYHPHLVSPGETIDASKCEPVHLGKHYGELAPRLTGAPLIVPTREYMGYVDEKKVEWLAMKAGAGDFDGTQPRARALCLFSCDTADYWKPIVQASQWKPSPDHGLVYYTSATDSPTTTTGLWLRHLFTYQGPAGPWKPSLDYAMGKTNAGISEKMRMGDYIGTPLQEGWYVVT